MIKSDILSAAISRPRVILGDDFEAGFRRLMREWHPDRNKDPDAPDVAAKLNLLLQSARNLAKNGGYKNRLIINPAKGETYDYMASVPSSTGPVYICDKHVIWETERSNDDLCHRWLETIKSFKFPSGDIQEEFNRYLPLNSHCVGKGEVSYTIISKPREVVRLSDVVAKRGAIEARTVAWIISNMLNQACWLQFSGISHFGITPENYFVNPEKHVGCLYGGWFFSAPKGARPLAAPAEVRTAIPDLKTATPTTVHSALIKRTSRLLLGHNSLSSVRRDDKIPQALRDWLITPGAKDAVAEYREWPKVLDSSFGGRRFHKYDLTAADIYGD